MALPSVVSIFGGIACSSGCTISVFPHHWLSPLPSLIGSVVLSPSSVWASFAANEIRLRPSALSAQLAWSALLRL